MSEEQAQEQAQEQNREAVQQPKKKVSWVPTILWMLKMILIFNVVAGIIMYYFLTRQP